jgi:ligand-binding sensor domain-containing protein
MKRYQRKYLGRLGAIALTHCLLQLQYSFGQLSGNLEERANLSDFPFSIIAYSIRNNIPQSQVVDIVKIHETGELIFSTANGVVKFNGHAFENYMDHVDYRRTIFEKLYYCNFTKTLFGLELDGKFTALGARPEYLGHIAAADIRGDYHAVIRNDGKLEYHNHSSNSGQHISTGIMHPNFLYIVNDTTCLVSAEKKGYIVSLRTGKKKVIVHDDWVGAVQHGYDSSLVVISSKKIYRFKDGVIGEVKIPQAEDFEFTNVESVNDLLVFSSPRGMLIISPEKITFYSEKDVFPTNILSCVFYDQFEGCLFVGTSTRGLLKLIPKRCQSFYANRPEYQSSFGAIVYDKDHGLYVTTMFGVNHFSEGRFSRLPTDKQISGLSQFGDTLAVLCRSGEILGYSKRREKKIFRKKVADFPVYAAFRDRGGTHWFGTDQGVSRGIFFERSTPFLPKQIENRITTIFEDSRGRLWLGGMNGVSVLDDQRRLVMHFDTGSIASAQDVRAFYEDPSGKIWIGTYGAGLFCFYQGKFISLKEKDYYQLGNDIFTLARDQYGYILMSSNNGVRAVHETALDNFLKGRSSYLIPLYIGEHSGIFNPEFNGGFHNNYASEGDSIFYFPSIQGHVRYFSKPFFERTNNLIINKIYLDDKVHAKPFRIGRKVKFIRFEFYNVNFSETQNIYYQYKIKDKNNYEVWSNLQKDPYIVLSHLAPGRYQLSLRVLDGLNSLSPPSVTYDFFIRPYFFETIFFHLFLFILVSILFFIRLERNHQRQKEAIAKELEHKNMITEMQLTAIQSQMKPHFLFNTLNSLVNLIASRDLRRAENYAVSLSRLLRNTLEQSGKVFIPVEHEIATLNKFLEIQQSRFNFTFEINCPRALLHRELPTMLLQPLLENALIHGIAHLTDRTGRITLDFTKLEEQGIQIDLRDNGIGMNKSQMINAGKKQKSFGIEMVRRKIALLKERYQIIVSMEVSVLDPSNMEGTHICLKICQSSV